MYNYQTYRKEQQVNKRCSDIRKDKCRADLHRQKLNPSLAHSHKKRVEGFILSMLDKPVQVQHYENNSPAFRSYDSSKNISINGFYLRHENETIRIAESLRKNSTLDPVPFNNTFSHQFRQQDGSCKPIKFKAINHNFRIKEQLDRQCLNYLPNSQQLSLHKHKSKENSNLQSLNRIINKSLLPMLHSKTYFKSVAALYSAPPVPQNRAQYRQLDTSNDDDQIRKETSKTNEHLNRSQNSRQALVKCKLLPTPRKDNHPPIRA